MKKIIQFLLSLTLILMTVTCVLALEPPRVEDSKGVPESQSTQWESTAIYKDIKTTNWAYPAIKAMSEKNIVKGYPNGIFKPANILTYGEFLKMVILTYGSMDLGNAVDAEGKAELDKTTGQKKHWAQNYYDTALEKAYFTAYQIHQSQLENYIPRADMALIISAILGDFKPENYDALQNSIKDVNAQTKYEYDIIKSYGAGILTGYEDGSFNPQGTLTRAESAVIMYRLTDASKRVLPDIERGIPMASQGAITTSVIYSQGSIGKRTG